MEAVWMPFLRCCYSRYGQIEHKVGKAIFCADTDDKWNDICGCARPLHLSAYRDFPGIDSDVVGEPLYGTLVWSEDDAWLSRFIDEAVAITYFLGDKFRSGVPAECFAYFRIQLYPDRTDATDLVSYSTKHGRLIESSRSLMLLPPLAVRGNLRPYRLNIDIEATELLRRFDENPHDRMVVAVRQYFRTQFSDVFASPPAQDYATYCGALEAALDIDGTQRGVGDRLADELIAIYGDEPQFREFFLGLYIARSLFVHGASNATNSSEKRENQSLGLFDSCHGKFTLLRMLVRDVLRRKLRTEVPPSYSAYESALPLLRKVLRSDEIWQSLKKLLNRSRAADQIIEMDCQEFEYVFNLSHSLTESFDWQCVRQEIRSQVILRALCACALVIARLTESTGDIYVESDRLGRAATEADIEEIKAWNLDDPWSDEWIEDGNRLSAMQVITRCLSQYFNRY